MLANKGVIDGQRLLSENMIAEIAETRPPVTPDLGIYQDVRVGLGFYFNHGPVADFGPYPNSFGHTGLGGVTAFADVKRQIGFGYVTNHLYQPTPESSTMIGERAVKLAKVFYDCLG